MRLFLNRILLTLMLCLTTWIGIDAQTLRILPLGNSITYDHNSFDETNPRPEGDRISYRYLLYQLLKNDGFDFDFVGSENSGNNYFQNSEYDDNAGFPGIESGELADLISSGYNGYTHQYESPGPYLNYYPADLILLHIGTNNLTTSPNQVESILNNIRMYDQDVIVLVARIINRRIYHSSTTTFNDNVELMVHSRGDERIKMVNIETGAGINYSVDMTDNLHPNQTGYNKMAGKWYSSILSLNEPPVISSIPTQYTDKGEEFEELTLDLYVSDNEDSDFQLEWAYKQNPDSKLTISIDANRLMHVTPDPDWSGTETVKLKVKDSGNGAFPREDSMDVVFVVDHINTPPVITSSPQTSINQGELYNYVVIATDFDEDQLTYRASEKPTWLTLNPGSNTLSGIPEHIHIGMSDVELWVSDGADSVVQEFVIEVIDVNDPPVITSATNIFALEDNFFSYTIVAGDADGDPISYEVMQKPGWMTYNGSGHTLSGNPGNDQVGVYNFTVRLSDGTAEVYEPLKVTVVNENDAPVITSTPPTVIGAGESYFYVCTATDIDPDDILEYSAIKLPDWLSFTTSSTDALVYGVPEAENRGGNVVILMVSDGDLQVLQAFSILVSWPSDVSNSRTPDGYFIYPNPAKDKISLQVTSSDETAIKIYSTSGIILMERHYQNRELIEIDISELPEGIYHYELMQEDLKSSGTFIKNY